jgi:hypothetical protein
MLALLYVLDYISNQIPQVSKQILSAFGVSETTKYGEGAAEMVTSYASNAKNTVINMVKTIKGDKAENKTVGADKK